MSDGAGIIGRTKLTEADLAAAYRPLLRKSGVQGWFIMFWLAAIGVSVAKTWLDPEGWNPWLLVFIAVVTGGALFIGYMRGVRIWARRALADVAGEGAADVQFRFDDEGSSVDSALRQSRVGWAAVPREIETSDAFIIFTGSKTVQVVPKRAFDSSDVPRLQHLLRERVRPAPTDGWLRSMSRGAGRVVLLWFGTRRKRGRIAENMASASKKPRPVSTTRTGSTSATKHPRTKIGSSSSARRRRGASSSSSMQKSSVTQSASSARGKRALPKSKSTKDWTDEPIDMKVWTRVPGNPFADYDPAEGIALWSLWEMPSCAVGPVVVEEGRLESRRRFVPCDFRSRSGSNWRRKRSRSGPP